MANTRRAVRHDERAVVILGCVLFMLVLTAGVIWWQVFRILHNDRPMPLPVEDPELSVFDLLPEVAKGGAGSAVQDDGPPPVEPVETGEPAGSPSAGNAGGVPATAMPAGSRWTMAQLPTVVKRFPGEEAFVYLTFDDGPTKFLPAIVNCLIEKQAPATFFWIGRYAPPAPELIEKMRQAHLQVGSHTIDHRRLAGSSYEQQRHEIQRGIAKMTKWTGVETVYVRPPYGAWDARTEQAARDLGIKLVLWSVDPRDWEKDVTPDEIIERVLAQLHSGAVILLHEQEATLQALPVLIDRIREEGYQLAGLPEK